MRRLLILALLYGGMHLILPLGSAGQGSETLLTFGFLILAAYTVGEMAATVRLPKIVGYLFAGVLFGPSVLATVSAGGIGRLAAVNDLAVALIAFLAGAELRWREVRERGVQLLKLTGGEVGVTFVALALALYALSAFIPVLADAPLATVLAAALLFASVAVVHSPAVTMALLTETGARGPVARTTLSVVLLADVAVVLLFSGAMAVARMLAPPAGDVVAPPFAAVLWEIGGAPVVGVLLGGAVALYLRFVGRELMLFAVLVAFFAMEIARFAHVELLLTLLVAGFVTENFSREGERLRHAMERSAAPVFVVFFALSGARIDLAGVLPLLPVVVPLVLVRAAAIRLGTELGGRWAVVPAAERQGVWLGLVSQAGVAIGLAAIIANSWGELGGRLHDLLLALIAINTPLGAILFRLALARSGESAGGEAQSAEQVTHPAGRLAPAPRS